MKAPQTVIKHDIRLTRQARKIFGKTVYAAYVSTYYFENEAKEELQGRIKQASDSAVDKDDICLDGNVIIIKFNDGNMVEFQSSEWGHIRLFKSTYKLLED